MSIPCRIQRRRTKGWRMPPNTSCVDRSSRFGNPFRAGTRIPSQKKHLSPAEAVLLFAKALNEGQLRFGVSRVRAVLKGRNLACWCHLCAAHKDGRPLGVVCMQCAPCHADVLLEVANSQRTR